MSLLNALPIQVLENNNFIVLEIKAQRERAVSVSTSIVIDIIRQDIIHPVFSEAYYRGVYIEESGLQFEEQIYLISGHDDTVTYRLEGGINHIFYVLLYYQLFFLPTHVLTENSIKIFENLIIFLRFYFC